MAHSSEAAAQAVSNKSNRPAIQQSQQQPQVQQKNGNTFFFEDEVFTVDKRGRVKFGIIIMCSGAISDEEDEDYVDPGKVRVAWHPDGKETVVPINQIGLVDRTLAPGDVVGRLDSSGRAKQFGYCQEMTVCADMNVVGTKYVIKNVSATRCAPLHRMTTGAVLLDSWVGVSDMIKEKLVLQTSCGSLIEVVLCADRCPLWDIEDNPRGTVFSTPNFHVGQILVGPVAALENAKWLYTSPEMRGSRKNKTVNRKFIVQSVELDEVTIYWQMKPSLVTAPVTSIDETTFSEPPKVIRGEDLKRIRPMNVFVESMLQINDKHHVTVAATDEVMKKSDWKRELANKYQIVKESCGQRRGSSNLARSPKRNPTGCVKVVVSQEGIDGGGEGGVAEEDGRQSRQNLKAPPVQRGQSLGKLEHPNHQQQFLTVADTKRSHSLESSDPPTDSMEKQIYYGDRNLTNHWSHDWDEETSPSGSEFSSNTISSCSSTTTPRSSPKCSPLLANKLKKQLQQQRRKKRSERRRADGDTPKVPEPGQTVIARALVVYSTVTVLWQDGTLEKDIPSRQLFPMHTLDHHEFFPSDFVLHANAERDGEMDTEDVHHYGVIQTMDHVGRLAKVKWFETDKGFDQDPKYKGESEVSVYDLKDHLQFQYRPGTIVVRLRDRSTMGVDGEPVEGATDEEDGGPLGQVIDNSPEGKVKVVWVNNKMSMCWPQDIFELGNYDSGMFISHDHHFNFGDLDGGADDSWMTESEESHLGDQQSENKVTPADRLYLSESLERLKVSIVRLKMLFKQNPQILSANVVHELMVIYKKCRYFDRLMDTQFFHEEHFEGLVERVRKTAMGVRSVSGLGTGARIVPAAGEEEISGDVAVNEKVEDGFHLNVSHSTPIKELKRQKECEEESDSIYLDCDGMGGGEGEGEKRNKNVIRKLQSSSGDAQLLIESVITISENLNAEDGGQEENEKRQSIKKGDSGHYSEMDEDHSSASSCATGGHGMEHSNTNSSGAVGGVQIPTIGLLKPPGSSLEVMCSKFCNLLKQQLSKAFHEINTLYCTPKTEWEVVKEEAAAALTGDEESVPARQRMQMNESSTTEELNNSDQVGLEDGVPGAPPESFQVVDDVPTTHHFNLSLFNPKVPKIFYRAVKREHDLLRSGLPEGVWVRAYEERLDLFSVMIEGPTKTPYEDGVFLFDIQLGNDYPEEPPNCHYISYCHDRLNPNLYEEGRVCVSLLGTWSGKGTEKWGPNSSLLQLIVSIQGLILVAEPYFNEAGYEKQVGTQQGCENSQIYNEMVVIKLLQSSMKLVDAPPEIFRDRILNHFRSRSAGMIERIQGWVQLSREVEAEERKEGEDDRDEAIKKKRRTGVPDFPLVPASRGFCITVESLLGKFKNVIEKL